MPLRLAICYERTTNDDGAEEGQAVMQLDGQIAIITGGASGLGEGTAREFAAAGAKVALFDIQEDKGEAVARDLGGLFCKCDVTSEDSVQSAIAATKDKLGVARI